MFSVFVRNLLFTIVVPGAGAVWLPWWILTRFDAMAVPAAWPAVAVIALGAGLYLWCVWVFAVVGRGTPGPWDAPRRVVATGPYRWVRNPIYLTIRSGCPLMFDPTADGGYKAMRFMFTLTGRVPRRVS